MGKDRGGVSDWPLPLLLHNCRGRGAGRCGSSMFSVYLVQLFPTPRDQRDLLAPQGLLVSQETKETSECPDRLGPRDHRDLL